MANLNATLRPIWIFETLRLWKPATSVPILMEQAMDLTAQELAATVTRRRAVEQVFRFYVEHKGRGAQRRTLTQNVWAAYVRGYRAHALTPTFLTHLAACSDLAQATGQFFQSSATPGTALSTAALRAYLAQHHPSRRFSDSAISIWVRTLVHFQVLTPGQRLGDYTVRRLLPVAGSLFPLLVYSWAGARQCGWVEPAHFARDPILAYVDDTGFDRYWQIYAGYLWYGETYGTGEQARHGWRLRYTDPGAMARALINLLTTYRRPRRYALAAIRASKQGG